MKDGHVNFSLGAKQGIPIPKVATCVEMFRASEKTGGSQHDTTFEILMTDHLHDAALDTKCGTMPAINPELPIHSLLGAR
jgi:hypothetical protein